MNREQFRSAFVNLSPSRQELILKVMEDLIRKTNPRALKRLQEGYRHEQR